MSIFPSIEEKVIKEALDRANGCIETATEVLLQDDGTVVTEK